MLVSCLIFINHIKNNSYVCIHNQNRNNMNHVFGNGEAQPERKCFTYGKETRNEFKGYAYIIAKHMIETATAKTWEATVNYVNLFVTTQKNSQEDKDFLKNLLIQKQKSI